jgi:pseudoazurin
MNIKFIALTTVLLFSSFSLSAKNFEVKLLTSDSNGQSMVMSPGYLKIEKGDTVTFIPSDITHNVESIAIPNLAKSFTSKMGEKFSYTFAEQGVYLYKCSPHFALGMLGVIQVGSPDNLNEVNMKWSDVSSGVVMNKERVIKYLSEVK